MWGSVSIRRAVLLVSFPFLGTYRHWGYSKNVQYSGTIYISGRSHMYCFQIFSTKLALEPHLGQQSPVWSTSVCAILVSQLHFPLQLTVWPLRNPSRWPLHVFINVNSELFFNAPEKVQPALVLVPPDPENSLFLLKPLGYKSVQNLRECNYTFDLATYESQWPLPITIKHV